MIKQKEMTGLDHNVDTFNTVQKEILEGAIILAVESETPFIIIVCVFWTSKIFLKTEFCL